jgi:hypothetical protein
MRVTRPVAVARSLIVTGLLWGTGVAIVVGLFSLVDASSTIRLDEEERSQVVWLGAHALVACISVLAGVILGGSALIRQHVAPAGSAAATVGVPTVAVAALAALLLGTIGAFEGAALPAVLAGLAIGAVAATGYLFYTGEPDDVGSYGLRARSGHETRGWSSR